MYQALKKMRKINVTKTYLPPLETYIKYLKGIWHRGHVTNNGLLTRELENKLKKKLGVKHLFLVSNGTLALQIAIKALNLSKDIITTPMSFIATSSSIKWEKCRIIYADIDPESLNIDPAEIEKKITKDTEAILATHLFGIPCNIEKIKTIAQRHKLKIIYDAAHAFGVNYNSESILGYGDISIISLHATKIFHTAEGGALITNSDKIAKRLSYMRNFGYDGSYNILGLGINAKMSELHSAMGLSNLPYLNKIVAHKKKLSNLYDSLIEKHSIPVRKPTIPQNTKYNFSYYPVIFNSTKETVKIKKLLEQRGVYPRRYFHPSLNTLKFLEPQNVVMPVAEDVSNKILCLPLGFDLNNKDIERIIKIIKSFYA